MQDLLAQMVEASKETSRDELQREFSIDDRSGGKVQAVVKSGKGKGLRRFASRASSSDHDTMRSSYGNPVLAAEAETFDSDAPRAIDRDPTNKY